MGESSWRRAFNDAISAQRSAKFMWGGEGVLAVAGGAILSQIAPASASTYEIVFRSVIGGLGGLLTALVFIFGWNLYRAPYRQRNEAWALLKAKPKSIALTNRDRLLTAMAEVKIALASVIGNVADLRAKRQPNTMFMQSGRWEELASIDGRFQYSCELLQKEIFTAGKAFEPTLKPLGTTLDKALSLDISAVNQLEALITETRNKIDELSPPTPDTGGFQPK